VIAATAASLTNMDACPLARLSAPSVGLIHHGNDTGFRMVAPANPFLLLGQHVRTNGLGRVFGDGFGYELIRFPHTVRVPDLSFVRAELIPEGGIGPGLIKFAPDLAIEVLSPSESASALEEKLDDYTTAGTSLMWVVDPARRTVTVIAANAPLRWLREGDVLDGGEVIAGFSCQVSDIFEGIAR
jgi:Uma2 family endonuclease